MIKPSPSIRKAEQNNAHPGHRGRTQNSRLPEERTGRVRLFSRGSERRLPRPDSRAGGGLRRHHPRRNAPVDGRLDRRENAARHAHHPRALSHRPRRRRRPRARSRTRRRRLPRQTFCVRRTARTRTHARASRAATRKRTDPHRRPGNGREPPPRQARHDAHRSHAARVLAAATARAPARRGAQPYADRVVRMGHELRQRYERRRSRHSPPAQQDRRQLPRQADSYRSRCRLCARNQGRGLMRGRSITTTLALAFGATTLAVFVLVGNFLYRALEREISSQDDMSIVLAARHARRLAQEIEASKGIREHGDRITSIVLGNPGMSMEVFDPNGQLAIEHNLTSTLGMPMPASDGSILATGRSIQRVPPTARITQDDIVAWRNNTGAPIRGVATDATLRDGETVSILIARNLSDRYELLDHYRDQIKIYGIIGVLLTTVLSYLLI